MSGGCGMTSPRLLAEWNHDPNGSCSKTSEGCCPRMVGTLFDQLFTDWPTSGMWDLGGVYEPPMSEHRTGGSDGSVLPTCQARDWKGPQGRAYKGEAIDLPTACGESALLPTPRTSDANGAGAHGDGGPDLRTALLPTPTANDPKNAGYQSSNGKDYLTLPGAVGSAPQRGGSTKPRSGDGNE